MATAAGWIARALESSGYRADFTPGSLWDIERFMTEHSAHGTAVAGGLLAVDPGSRLFALGAYLGETVRRGLGGTWEAGGDPDGRTDVVLRLPDGAVVWPVQRVIKRFRNGSEDSITGYAIGLGLHLPARRRAWFRRG
ncbi:hypothetical protein [Streptomyces phaeofaciens]|uniref:hypothetical protein n=1 Tax=Streptomyces phaeofaciens TaxID=68254 RepID=UPI0036980DAF